MIAPKDFDTDRMKRLTAIAAAVLLAVPAYAGTNAGNFQDGKDAASAFCWSVDTRAWSYVGGLADARRDPVRSDFERAALEVGSELEAIYAKGLPADNRRVFRAGWETGMKDCAKELRY